ncbi:conserved hypothetical protein [Leishmania major strain Friedlin]|uniref:Uncharacterized protein n=1 Tax=Leishmania major TaxID=5664 RepID=E9AD76_LEIMA|nr:conserved hypothetical protein [Leishmania major strain Friedlin]CAG9576701.1 hypothetical_protein_-_conserved [Leishmania major strain Friedlin]CBZ12161.1 conserved hypothetical protein [Leishmania major strain Friedlin]|eukprot:XP_003721905.1 conserved hypothetical protein [Leishmania major strain Friedlin]
MKRGREEDKEAEVGGSRVGPSDRRSAATSTEHKPRRLLKGADVGLPLHESVIEETCEVEETHAVLVRFPCFDFFRHVRVCERTRDLQPATSDDAAKASASLASALSDTTFRSGAPPVTSTHDTADVAFAPEAAVFIPGTLETDAPRLLLNGGTPHEMLFEGQWTEVTGEGVSVTNRAVVHLSAKTAGIAVSPAALPLNTSPIMSDAAKSPELARAAAESFPASASQATATPALPIASLLTHTLAGVTADEERRQRAEQQKGWTYDRIDVPSAVLVMHRVR